MEPKRGLILTTSIFAAGLALADRTLIGPLLPLIMKRFDINAAQAGTIVSVLFLGFLVTTPLGGWLGDRMGRKWTIVLGMLGFGFFTGFTALVWAIPIFIGLRVLVGLFEGLVTSPSVAWVSDVYPESRGKHLGIWGFFVNIASVIGLVVVGWLGQTTGWRWPWLVFGIPTVVVALWIFYRVPDTRLLKKKKERQGYINWNKVLTNRNVLIGLVMAFLSAASFWGVTTWLATYMIKLRHMHVLGGGVFTALFVLGVGLGQLTAGAISDRLGRRVTISLWAGLAIIFLQVFLHSSGIAMVLTSMLAGYFSAYLPVLLALVSESLSTEIRATGLSVLYVGSEIGSLVGPLVGGIVADKVGIFQSINMVSFAYIAAALFIWVAIRPSSINLAQ